MVTYTMTTTVTLPDATAEQSMLAYAVHKGYHPTTCEIVSEEYEGVMTTSIVETPNIQSPLDYISTIKQVEMVEDMLSLSVRRIETEKMAEINATRSGLSQAVNVTIE